MSAKLSLALAAALIAGPALAADPPDDAPTATAAPGVAEQIEAFLRDSPAAQPPADATRARQASEPGPRQVHGVVEVAVGTHGYRSVYMRSDIPLGETGTLSIAVGDSRGPSFHGDGRGYGRRFVPGLPLEPVDPPSPR